jgi:hypothetical protein
MKPYHQVTGLHFEGDVMILTIDGQEKRFQVSDISLALQHASEQERNGGQRCCVAQCPTHRSEVLLPSPLTAAFGAKNSGQRTG